MSGIRQVLLLHGAGDGAHAEDALIAEPLQAELGAGYCVRCPQLVDSSDAEHEAWTESIARVLAGYAEPVAVVAHSFGASALLKLLAESSAARPGIGGVYLLAAPFWGEEGWTYDGFTMPTDLGAGIPDDVPVHLFHNEDDEVVPFAHLAHNARALPSAVVHAELHGGHQFVRGVHDVAAAVATRWRGVRSPATVSFVDPSRGGEHT